MICIHKSKYLCHSNGRQILNYEYGVIRVGRQGAMSVST